jgi:hypothetical protein
MANLVAVLPGLHYMMRAGERVNLRAVLQNCDKEKKLD